MKWSCACYCEYESDSIEVDAATRGAAEKKAFEVFAKQVSEQICRPDNLRKHCSCDCYSEKENKEIVW